MGIFSYMSSMKKKHLDKQYQRAKVLATEQREELRKLQEIEKQKQYVQQIKAQKKNIRELKHPFLTKAMKGVKKNVVRQMEASRRHAQRKTESKDNKGIFESGFQSPFEQKKPKAKKKPKKRTVIVIKQN